MGKRKYKKRKKDPMEIFKGESAFRLKEDRTISISIRAGRQSVVGQVQIDRELDAHVGRRVIQIVLGMEAYAPAFSIEEKIEDREELDKGEEVVIEKPEQVITGKNKCGRCRKPGHRREKCPEGERTIPARGAAYSFEGGSKEDEIDPPISKEKWRMVKDMEGAEKDSSEAAMEHDISSDEAELVYKSTSYLDYVKIRRNR